MRKVLLLAGAAALAASIPALAKNDDRGRGGGKGANAEQHQGHGKGNGRAERGRGGGDQRAEHRGNRKANAQRGRGGGNDRARVQQAGRGGDEKAGRRLSREERRVEQALRSERRQVREARREIRGNDDRRLVIRDGREDRRDWSEWTERRMAMRGRFDDDRRRWSRGAWGRDCPPGLARQNAFCMPPGQLRKARFIGQRLPLSNLAYNVPERYRYRFLDDDRWLYRYDDAGTVYRFDRSSGLVSNVVPLYATGLFVGEPLPLGYEVYNLPIQYRSLYRDSDDYLYRYGDNAIYRVDAETNLIEGIVALLSGGGGLGGLGSLGGLGGLGGGLGSLAGLGGLGVGDMLPSGYDAYNVPLDHRDTYFDTDESMYRYADGYVYEVDPETRLIEAVISLLT